MPERLAQADVIDFETQSALAANHRSNQGASLFIGTGKCVATKCPDLRCQVHLLRVPLGHLLGQKPDLALHRAPGCQDATRWLFAPSLIADAESPLVAQAAHVRCV